MLACWQFGRALYGGDANPSGIARIRDPYFRAVYSKTQSLVNSGQSLAGTLFWQVCLHPINTDNCTITSCSFVSARVPQSCELSAVYYTAVGRSSKFISTRATLAEEIIGLFKCRDLAAC